MKTLTFALSLIVAFITCVWVVLGSKEIVNQPVETPEWVVVLFMVSIAVMFFSSRDKG